MVRICDRFLRPRTVAHAHSGTNSYVFVFIGRRRVWGTVQMLTHDLAHILDDFDTEAPDAARAVAYASEHFELGPIGEASWPIRFDRTRILEDHGTYLIMHYDVDTELRQIPDSIRIRFDGIVHADHHHEIVATVHHEVGMGDLTIRTTDRYSLTAASVEVVVPLRRLTSIDRGVGAAKAIVSRCVRAGRRVLKRSS